MELDMMDKQATVNTCYHMNSLNDRWMMRLKAVYLGGIAPLKSMALHRTRRVATERLKTLAIKAKYSTDKGL